MVNKKKRDAIFLASLRDVENPYYGVFENQEELNDSNRQAICDMKKKYGKVFLGGLHPGDFGQPGLYEFQNERLYNFCCDFCIPKNDPEVRELICAVHDQKNFTAVDRLLERIRKLNGKIFIWS